MDGKATIVGNEVDAQRAFGARASDQDVDVGWEGLLGVVVVLYAPLNQSVLPLHYPSLPFN